MIKGIERAVQRRADFGIRVLNLSLGTDPTLSTTLSQLNQAVQRAWDAGITVVASAGNLGPGNGTTTKPGDDPLIITSKASDDTGTAATSDDTMTSFSSVGPTFADGWFEPDLVAPGRSVVSLRSEKSTIDLAYPDARIGTANFKGSGSSSSAAIASGAAALLLRAHPDATPNDVKGRMRLTAKLGPVGNPMVDGHGLLDVATAVAATGVVYDQDNVVRYGMASPAVNGTVDLGTTWTGSSWNGSSWNGCGL